MLCVLQLTIAKHAKPSGVGTILTVKILRICYLINNFTCTREVRDIYHHAVNNRITFLMFIGGFTDSFTHLDDVDQPCSTSGQLAKCGQKGHFVRPNAPLQLSGAPPTATQNDHGSRLIFYSCINQCIYFIYYQERVRKYLCPMVDKS